MTSDGKIKLNVILPFVNEKGNQLYSIYDNKGKLKTLEEFANQVKIKKDGVDRDQLMKLIAPGYEKYLKDLNSIGVDISDPSKITGSVVRKAIEDAQNGLTTLKINAVKIPVENPKEIRDKLLSGSLGEIKEIESFDPTGKMSYKAKRVEEKDLKEMDKGKEKYEPLFNNFNSVNSEGLIMTYNNRYYMIPYKSIGVESDKNIRKMIADLDKDVKKYKEYVAANDQENAWYVNEAIKYQQAALVRQINLSLTTEYGKAKQNINKASGKLNEE